MELKNYAVYKGDRLIFVGTINECANVMSVKPNTIRWYTNPIAKERNKSGNRIEVIKVED